MWTVDTKFHCLVVESEMVTRGHQQAVQAHVMVLAQYVIDRLLTRLSNICDEYYQHLNVNVCVVVH